MSKYKVVLFDFDGTFVDSGTGILNSVEYALEKHSIPLGDRSRLNYFIGPPLYVGFNHLYGVEGEECDSLVDAYRERYKEKGVFEFEIYDGIVELIEELKGSGIKVGVASAKPEVFIYQMLE
ncbi:MAG: HAD hydrolase-like protein, partial [Oscillospiraceae bacterium]